MFSHSFIVGTDLGKLINILYNSNIVLCYVMLCYVIFSSYFTELLRKEAGQALNLLICILECFPFESNLGHRLIVTQVCSGLSHSTSMPC
jgi:hypothetical protein